MSEKALGRWLDNLVNSTTKKNTRARNFFNKRGTRIVIHKADIEELMTNQIAAFIADGTFGKDAKLADDFIEELSTLAYTELLKHINRIISVTPTDARYVFQISRYKETKDEYVVFTKDGKRRNVFGFLQKNVFKPTNDTLANKASTRLASFDLEGFKKGHKTFIDVGHMLGSGVGYLSILKSTQNVIQNLKNNDQDPDALKVAKLLESRLKSGSLKNRKTLLDVYMTNKINSQLSKEVYMKVDTGIFVGEWEILVAPQSFHDNRKVLAPEEVKANNILAESLVKDMKIDGSIVDLATIKGSPSVTDDLALGLVNYQANLIDKKKRKVKVKRKQKVTNTKALTNKGGLKAKGKLKTPTYGKSTSEVVLNLTNINAIINEHLPQYIERNMGKGTAREVLNYRTGRFANTSTLKVLTEVKGSRGMMLRGVLDYMRNPYDVFRPGGKLYKPGRDPKLLIDKSIRQILKEKALIKLSFTSVV